MGIKTWLVIAGCGWTCAAVSLQPLGSRDRGCDLISERLASVDLADCLAADLTLAEAGSVERSPILVGDYPPPENRYIDPPRVLLVGGIHGDELSSVSVVFGWIRQLQADGYRAIHWRIVPSLNPDGLLRNPAQRTNARGVDLNRNFPILPQQTNPRDYWVRRTSRDPRRYPGKVPLSEPESSWLAREIETFSPDAVVQVHAPYGVLDYDGPPEPPARLGFLNLKLLGAYPGSLGNFMGVGQGQPVITLELPYAGIMPTTAQQRSLWNDLQGWMARNLPPREEPPLFLQLTNNPWAQEHHRLLGAPHQVAVGAP